MEEICQPQTYMDVALQYNENSCEKCKNNKKCYQAYLEWSLGLVVKKDKSEKK